MKEGGSEEFTVRSFVLEHRHGVVEEAFGEMMGLRIGFIDGFPV